MFRSEWWCYFLYSFSVLKLKFLKQIPLTKFIENNFTFYTDNFCFRLLQNTKIIHSGSSILTHNMLFNRITCLKFVDMIQALANIFVSWYSGSFSRLWKLVFRHQLPGDFVVDFLLKTAKIFELVPGFGNSSQSTSESKTVFVSDHFIHWIFMSPFFLKSGRRHMDKNSMVTGDTVIDGKKR